MISYFYVKKFHLIIAFLVWTKSWRRTYIFIIADFKFICNMMSNELCCMSWGRNMDDIILTQFYITLLKKFKNKL